MTSEIPFDIPKNWSWARLSSIGTTNIGLTYRPENICENGTIVLRSSNIKNNKIDLNDLVRVNSVIHDNQYINNNDILICARNGSKALVGKCALYMYKDQKMSFGAFMAIFRTICYKYTYYYFLSKQFRSNFENENNKQINQVTQDILKNSLIPIPPLQEQHKICETIEKYFDLLNSIENNINSIKELVYYIKNKILDHFFCENSSYKSYYEKEIDITEDVIIFDNLRKPINHSEREKRLLNSKIIYPYYGATGQVGSIDDYIFDGEYVLLGEDGAPFLDKFAVKAYLIVGKSWVNNHVHVLKSKSNNKFLMYYLNWIDYTNLVTGSTRLKLNQANLKKIKYFDVPAKIKNEIVSKIEILFKIIESFNI